MGDFDSVVVSELFPDLELVPITLTEVAQMGGGPIHSAVEATDEGDGTVVLPIYIVFRSNGEFFSLSGGTEEEDFRHWLSQFTDSLLQLN
jgi:hypothetical protein